MLASRVMAGNRWELSIELQTDDLWVALLSSTVHFITESTIQCGNAGQVHNFGAILLTYFKKMKDDPTLSYFFTYFDN